MYKTWMRKHFKQFNHLRGGKKNFWIDRKLSLTTYITNCFFSISFITTRFIIIKGAFLHHDHFLWRLFSHLCQLWKQQQISHILEVVCLTKTYYCDTLTATHKLEMNKKLAKHLNRSLLVCSFGIAYFH